MGNGYVLMTENRKCLSPGIYDLNSRCDSRRRRTKNQMMLIPKLEGPRMKLIVMIKMNIGSNEILQNVLALIVFFFNLLFFLLFHTFVGITSHHTFAI